MKKKLLIPALEACLEVAFGLQIFTHGMPMNREALREPIIKYLRGGHY